MSNSSFARLTSSPGLFQSNLSFYAVPAAWALSLLPHVYAIALYNKERAPDTNEWDMALPAKNITHVKDGKLSPAMQDRFLRAEAANNNSFVGLPLFAGAIIAGNMARIPASTLNAFALTYLGFRTAFVVLYVNGTTKALANARFASWLGASFTCLTLFVKAGNQFRRALAL